jgi:hypothetical protein
MGEMHSLLKRQLKRHFGDSSAIPEGLQGFIDIVNSTYKEFDIDRSIIERSLDLTSQELLEGNRQLSIKNKELEDAQIKLKKAKDELEIKVEERITELKKINEQLLAEIRERKKVEEALLKREQRLKNQHAVLLELTKSDILSNSDLRTALYRITEASSRAIGIERAAYGCTPITAQKSDVLTYTSRAVTAILKALSSA